MSDLHRRYQLLHGSDTEAARAELARIAASPKPALIVSACLLGVRCRYDGDAKPHDAAVARVVAGRDVELVPLCPEVLARMGVPRPPMTLSADGKRATTQDGRDVTATLDAGVRLADLLATQTNATEALLKERSPSCGVTAIHTDAGVAAGAGKFTERLRARGLKIVSEET